LPTVTPASGRTFEEIAAEWQAQSAQVFVFTLAGFNAEQIGESTFRLARVQPLSFELKMVNLYPDKHQMLFVVLVDHHPVAALFDGVRSETHLVPIPYGEQVTIPITLRDLPQGFHDISLLGFADPFQRTVSAQEERSQVRDDFIAYRLSLLIGESPSPTFITYREPDIFPTRYEPLGPALTLSDRRDVPHQWSFTRTTARNPVRYSIFVSALSSVTPCDEFALLAFLNYQLIPINSEDESPLYLRVCDRRTGILPGETSPLEPGEHALVLVRVPNPGIPLMRIRAQSGVSPFDYDPIVSPRVWIEVTR
jgi:hypothetical protein